MERAAHQHAVLDEPEAEVTVSLGPTMLAGDLAVPARARGIVLFAHGSGSSRFSPRNRQVARALQRARLATLLLDLLTRAEAALDARTAHLRFDIPLLAGRLAGVADWLASDRRTRALPLGLFGASTGASAALITAAERPGLVRAVVSRGGRPDLAGPALGAVAAPTLLIVGGRDAPVLDLNQLALADLVAAAARELVVVPGATHLFEEPGALGEVARLAAEWFGRYLAVPGAPAEHA